MSWRGRSPSKSASVVCSSVAGIRYSAHGGVPHTFASVGSRPALLVIAFTPAAKIEEFFRATAIPTATPRSAAFFRKYWMTLPGLLPFCKLGVS